MRTLLAGLCALLFASPAAVAKDAVPQRVTFKSADGKTELVGYLFSPAGQAKAGQSAVVMMHGRAGAYSSRANGRYDATTLSMRHKAWGNLWAEAGYLALLVDGFGPRGYPAGFPKGSYENRPEELNEVTVRPLDAQGALAYLIREHKVRADHVGLHGWSNGGSATLATLGNHSPKAGEHRFKAALAFYPACGLKDQFHDKYVPYAPVHVFMGRADEEVSPKRCEDLVRMSQKEGGKIEIDMFDGATHDFDSPDASRQRVPENVKAREIATRKAKEFFGRYLGTQGGEQHVGRIATAMKANDMYPKNDGKSRKMCTMNVGDTGEVLGSKPGQPEWLNIRGTKGQCSGKTGWVWNAGEMRIAMARQSESFASAFRSRE